MNTLRPTRTRPPRTRPMRSRPMRSRPMRSRPTRSRPPRGYLMILTLGTLAFLSSILLSIVPTALQSKRQTRNEALRLQGDYVLRAVLQRSLDRLATDANYTGETWTLQLPAPPSYPTGQHASEITSELTSGPLASYQASGEVTIAAGVLKIQFLLTPASASPLAEATTPSPTSAQPMVTIQKTWQLSSDLLDRQSHPILSAIND